MVEITLTKTATVPDGPVCENWAYRTYMPAEQQFRCDHLRRDSSTVSDRDMGGAGSGTSTLYWSRCALFDASLSEERGVGPAKCAACLKACAEALARVTARGGD